MFCIAGSLLVCATSAAAAAGASEGPPAPYSMDMAWYDAWRAAQPAVEPAVGGRRSLAGSASGSCNVQLIGNGQRNGVASARISCSSSGGGRVQVSSPLASTEAWWGGGHQCGFLEAQR